MDSESSERNCRGQNSSPRRVVFIIGKLLKLRCLKWDCIAHLNICNTSYGQKKGRESKWQFDSRPLKVRNRPNSLTSRQRATYHWKDLDKGYKFALDLIEIAGLHRKLCALKVVGVHVLEFRNSHLGVPGQKAIWMWPPWRGTEYIIRGKVVASLKFGPC
jgi:hypothetical protein